VSGQSADPGGLRREIEDLRRENGRLQRGQLASADAVLEHEPDDGLVAAVVEGLVRPMGGRGAGGEEASATPSRPKDGAKV